MNETISIDDLVGKLILLCYNVVDKQGKRLAQYQESAFFHGMTSVVHLRLEPDFEEIYLPPDLSVFRKAKAGTYKCHSTDTEVIDPEFIAEWTITCNDSKAAAEFKIPRYKP